MGENSGGVWPRRGISQYTYGCVAVDAIKRLESTPDNSLYGYAQHDISTAHAILTFCVRYGLRLREAMWQRVVWSGTRGHHLACAMFHKAQQQHYKA